MAFQSFRTIAKYLAPAWLTSDDGELVNYSLDLMRDAFIERVRLGLLTRFPQRPNNGTSPPDALVQLGRDRRVVRGINESDPSYAARMLPWIDDRKTCGNPFALLKKIGEYIGPGSRIRTVDNRGNWFTQDYDGSTSFVFDQANWDWDKIPQWWSRFWVIIYPRPAAGAVPALWVQSKNWGDASGPSWGDAVNTWGSTATADQVASIQGIVADWKPAGTRCVNIVIAFDPASFDPSAAVDSSGMPDGLWEYGGKYVGGVYVSSRLSTAIYWDGV